MAKTLTNRTLASLMVRLRAMDLVDRLATLHLEGRTDASLTYETEMALRKLKAMEVMQSAQIKKEYTNMSIH